jgi:hypothetical protein
MFLVPQTCLALGPLRGFVTITFEFVSHTPNPEPEGPGTTLRLASTVWPVWHGWHYQQLTLQPA